jgi:hypothetical protein
MGAAKLPCRIPANVTTPIPHSNAGFIQPPR